MKIPLNQLSFNVTLKKNIYIYIMMEICFIKTAGAF